MTSVAYAGPTTTELRPDEDEIARLFHHWFGQSMNGHIDIGWYNAGTSEITNFKRFDVGQLDEVAPFVAETNAVPGQSIYFRPALVFPGAPKYVKDADFLGSIGVWCDLDKEGVADGAKNVYTTCRPTMAVVTGRKPYKRAQLFWMADEEIADPAALRDINTGIARLFAGDTKVINPTSLMRIGGTIAWPYKDGRVIERTEALIFKDGRPKAYPVTALRMAFPLTRAVAPATETAGAQAGSLGIDTGVRVSQLLAAVRSGNEWHNNMVRLVAHWISRGWSDTEIAAMAPAVTLPGYQAQATEADLLRMAKGARDKWGIPSEDHQADDQLEDAAAALAPRAVGALNPADIPLRPWLFGRWALLGAITLLIAPPGVGKSTWTVELGVAIAAGMGWAGQRLHTSGPVPVWIYNNEDDEDEMDRRISAAAAHMHVPLDRIRSTLYRNSGSERALFVARQLPDGSVVTTPDIAACVQHIKARGIRLFVVDPFVETHGVPESDNQGIKEVAVMYRNIARQCACAVILVHHTSKPPIASPEAHIGNMFSSRGASSLPGVARIALTLFGATKEDAAELGIDEKQRRLMVRLDDAKSNYSLPGEANWFRRVGVTLPNGGLKAGDEVGVLEPLDMSEMEDARAQREDDERDELTAAVATAVGIGGELSVNRVADKLKSDRAGWSHRKLCDRIKDTVKPYPDYTRAMVDGRDLKLFRVKRESGIKGAWLVSVSEQG